MGQLLSFLPLAPIAFALMVLGVAALFVRHGERRRDSQHSRESQFLAEQSLELSRQRAGQGTPPAGAALHPAAGVGVAHGDRCSSCGLVMQPWHTDAECITGQHRLTDDRFSAVSA